MFRKRNCVDNTSQEFFFGHLEDEVQIKECQTLDELKNEVKR